MIKWRVNPLDASSLVPDGQAPLLTYEEAVAYISGQRTSGQRTDRARFVALLERLGNPQQNLKCIHVAGTNGKGSTTTFIASVLREAGFRVGAYFSPYVFDLRERVQVNGELIPREDFARHVSEIRPHVEALAATSYGQTPEFELKTAVAFRHFAEVGIDYAVIEVGIGGRLDATNVIPPPLAAVITNIGWDHRALLGDTLAKIAGEKAGILKTETIAVTAEPLGEAWDAIAGIAEARQVPLYRVRPESAPDAGEALVTYTRDNDGKVRLQLPTGSFPPLRLALRGAYQAANAATAAAALEILRRERGVPISDAVLRRGLETAHLPGRFQVLKPHPEGPTLILDAAHNEDGAATLAEALQTEFGTERRYTLVFGTSRGHAPGPFLEILAPLVRRLYATTPPFKPTPAAETARVAVSLGIPVREVESARTAIETAYREASRDDIVVVTGSFYIIGETPAELRKG